LAGSQSEANQRIDQALGEARAHLKPSSSGIEEKRTAILHYFDAVAWEYVCTKPTAEFEQLLPTIASRAARTLDGSREDFAERFNYWILEARDRQRNGICLAHEDAA